MMIEKFKVRFLANSKCNQVFVYFSDTVHYLYIRIRRFTLVLSKGIGLESLHIFCFCEILSLHLPFAVNMTLDFSNEFETIENKI